MAVFDTALGGHTFRAVPTPPSGRAHTGVGGCAYVVTVTVVANS